MRVREMADKRVLIVDDLSVIRGFVKAALRDLGVIVHEASDGSQALDLQDSFAADVIICDISMPGMNGEEFLTRLRDRGDTTPVIMLTADGDKAVVSRLLKKGIQGYLLKPFKPAVLCERVTEALLGKVPTPPAASAGNAPELVAASPADGSGSEPSASPPPA